MYTWNVATSMEGMVTQCLTQWVEVSTLAPCLCSLHVLLRAAMGFPSTIQKHAKMELSMCV